MNQDQAYEAIVSGTHGDPFSVLGMHRNTAGLQVTAFFPNAQAVQLIDEKPGAKARAMKRLHPEGLFGLSMKSRKEPFPYSFKVTWDDVSADVQDPYRFPPLLDDNDVWLLAEGKHQKLWQVLGAHPCRVEDVDGTRFAVWAPNAKRVSVVCDSNQWDTRRHPMRCRSECGVWELFMPGVAPGTRYKYDILDTHGNSKQKADPLAFYAEFRPATASIVNAEPEFVPTDAVLPMARNAHDAPIAIYEMHPGSWRRPDDGRTFLSWQELAAQAIPYVKDLGFTHIELLPISEYPFDGSWGYQPVGLYAPTSRFGDPESLRDFLRQCHREGLGVILDWVPGHFPTDEFGLASFDGTHLYEHADPRQGYHPDWNTLIYNYGRGEVRNFLTANALYWLECFGIDGLRVDAVASMLYLDYSRAQGEWVPNQYGGRENLDAIEFLKEFNATVAARRHGAITIAEESTAWPKVSHSVGDGGLGFNYKWNMGWMHDTLSYMQREPIHRQHHHHDMTFGLLYAFQENFILPLSHDEVVHGKGSLLQKMPGDSWQKFANLRAYLGFMYAHPGKKLLFMGAEFGQLAEWNHDQSLDWHLTEDAQHRGIQNLVRDLNRLYRERPAMHELDCDPSGFEWIVADDSDQSIFAFLRRGRDRSQYVIAIANFTPVVRHDYHLGVPDSGAFEELLNSDAESYGGSNVGNGGGMQTENVPSHHHPHSLRLTLPPLAILYLGRADGDG